MSDLGPYPRFSASHSKLGLLSACPRAYGLSTYASWQGWPSARHSTEYRRRAYLLKHLTSLHAVLGSAAHAEAARITRRVLDDAPLPAAADLTRRITYQVDASRRMRDYDAFARDPKGKRTPPMLRSTYYQAGADAREVTGARGKIEAVVRNLVSCELWAELRARKPARVLIEEESASFGLDGVPVWLRADLVIVWDEDGREVTFVEYKTDLGEHLDGYEQLAIAGLYARDTLGFRHEPDCWEGRIYNLASGETDTYEIGADDLLGAEKRIRKGIARMREYQADPILNRPLPIHEFPAREPGMQGRCFSVCPFLEICVHSHRLLGEQG